MPFVINQFFVDNYFGQLAELFFLPFYNSQIFNCIEPKNPAF
jgi:hypothetical protein